jgi:signal transduction histidine kinase
LTIGIPCVLAVTLGILQYGWISRAAVTEGQRRLEEEQRRVRSALLDLHRAVDSSFDDLRLAVSIMRTAMAMHSESEVAIAEQALSGWFQQTSFRSLIRGAWLMADAGGEAARTVHVTVDSQSGKLTRTYVPVAGLPIALQPAVTLLGDRTDAVPTEIERMRTTLGNEGYVLVWAAIGSSSGALAALEIDTATYLNVTLPQYLKRDAPAYAVTVHTASELPARTPDLNDGQRVDRATDRMERSLWLSVPGFWYAAGLRSSLDPLSSAPGPPAEASASSPSASGTERPDRAVGQMWFRSPSNDSVGFISVAYSDDSPPRGVTSWLVSNMAASAGIVLLLLATLVGALLLFMRMRELRTAEMEFVASMSHELRLPITVIRVIADNLTAGVVRDETRMAKYGDQIRRQTSRLSSMLEGMLLSAGLRGEGARPNLAPFNPCDAVARIVRELAALVEEHGVTVSVDCADAEVTVRGDASGFSLVLRNLLTNAILHAFPPASGEPRCVRIRVYPDRPSLLCLEVSDNGPGVPKKEQRAIFEPFARTSKSLSEQHQGSGLGLHIARRVARMSEGSLSLSSPYQDTEGEVHRGCRFVATMKCGGTHDGE